MYTIEANDVNELLGSACHLVMTEGKEVTVRGMKTLELHPVMIKLTNPLKRTLLFTGRGNSSFATAFETLWVLASKDNNINYLKEFLPRAPDYSDDGKRWRAGYPERIRCFPGDPTGQYTVDQLKYVYQKLKQDPDTRQAVMVLWSPLDDTFDFNGNKLLNSRDIPCTNHVVFLIRNGKLDVTVTMRSNDVIFGLTAINMYEFTVMQEILAGCLGVEVGNYYHITNSLHIYEQHYEKATKIMNDSKNLTFLANSSKFWVTEYQIPVFRWELESTWEITNELYECLYIDIVDYIKTGKFPDIKRGSVVLEELFAFFKVYLYFKNYPFDEAKFNEYMSYISYTDLKVSCVFWMLKKFKVIEPHEIEKAVQYCELQCK